MVPSPKPKAQNPFVDNNFKQYLSGIDMVYLVKTMGMTEALYIPIEHQSSAPLLMPFRLLRYKVSVMQQHLERVERGHKKRAAVIPFVFYQGNQYPYPDPTELIDCFQHPTPSEIGDWRSFQLIQLIDLTAIADEMLRTHRSIAALELVQKYIKTKDLVDIGSDLLDVWARYPLAEKHIRNLLYYLAHKGESTDYPKFLQLISQTPNRGDIMTLAQYLREEGWTHGQQKSQEEGREEDRKEEALIIAKNMLAQGLAISLISKVTKLSDAEIIALMN